MKYITTPIYYVNDNPHIGHAVTTLAADVLARFWQLKGEEVFFLTGTDEHGAKIAEAAEKAGKEPQEFANEISLKFQEAWELLNIQPDGFIRTTDPNHKKVVQDFLQQLYDSGAIYKGTYKGWYCVGCEEFKTGTQIGEGNTCPIHKRPLTEVEEESYLFKLSEYQERIVALIESDELKIRPESRKNEVLSFIKSEGLRDTAISRKNVAWGILVPWDESHTVYVWVDALFNYLSAAENDGPTFASGKKPQFPPSVQLIGKDILRFHAVIWPGLLLAAGKELPKELLVNGFFTVEGQKMSKSLGNVITPQQLIDRYGVDGARYVLLAAVPFGADGDISLSRLDEIYNSELANKLGNLVNRVQAMLTQYRQGRVPQVVYPIQYGSSSIGPLLVESFDRVEAIQSIMQEDVLAGLGHVGNLISTQNTYIEQSKPWSLAKNHDPHLEEVLATLAENLFVLGALIAPFLPETSQKILSIFGASSKDINYDTLLSSNHTAGKTIAPIAPLFPRLEVE